MSPQVGLGGPRQSSDRPGPTPSPWSMGFDLLLLWNGQMTMSFGTVQETVILTPRTLSFSLVFFISVTAVGDAAGFQRLRHSADPSHTAGGGWL